MLKVNNKDTRTIKHQNDLGTNIDTKWVKGKTSLK